MGEFQKMQRYVAECAGGEWTEHGCWSYDKSIVDAGCQAGLEVFLGMRTADDDLGHECLLGVSDSLTWLVWKGMTDVRCGLEGVAIRTRIREFARDCKEDARGES